MREKGIEKEMEKECVFVREVVCVCVCVQESKRDLIESLRVCCSETENPPSIAPTFLSLPPSISLFLSSTLSLPLSSSPYSHFLYLTPTASPYLTLTISTLLPQVFQGMLMSDQRRITCKDQLARLWVHECERVFGDRYVL